MLQSGSFAQRYAIPGTLVRRVCMRPVALRQLPHGAALFGHVDQDRRESG